MCSNLYVCFYSTKSNRSLICNSKVTECYASHENFALAEVTLTEGCCAWIILCGRISSWVCKRVPATAFDLSKHIRILYGCSYLSCSCQTGLFWHIGHAASQGQMEKGQRFSQCSAYLTLWVKLVNCLEFYTLIGGWIGCKGQHLESMGSITTFTQDSYSHSFVVWNENKLRQEKSHQAVWWHHSIWTCILPPEEISQYFCDSVKWTLWTTKFNAKHFSWFCFWGAFLVRNNSECQFVLIHAISLKFAWIWN